MLWKMLTPVLIMTTHFFSMFTSLRHYEPANIFNATHKIRD